MLQSDASVMSRRRLAWLHRDGVTVTGAFPEAHYVCSKNLPISVVFYAALD